MNSSSSASDALEELTTERIQKEIEFLKKENDRLYCEIETQKTEKRIAKEKVRKALQELIDENKYLTSQIALLEKGDKPKIVEKAGPTKKEDKQQLLKNEVKLGLVNKKLPITKKERLENAMRLFSQAVEREYANPTLTDTPNTDFETYLTGLQREIEVIQIQIGKLKEAGDVGLVKLERERKEILQKSKELEEERERLLGEINAEKKAFYNEIEKKENDRQQFLKKLFPGGIVKLNVGGVEYATNISTVTSQPDTILAMIFSGKVDIDLCDDGFLFIDRDGTHFRYILNYLRSAEKFTMPTNKEVRRELSLESRFYGVHGLADLIDASLANESK